MVLNLISEVGYDYNYNIVELKTDKKIMRSYYNKLKDNSETLVSSILETKEDYINHYKESIKQKENEIKELNKMIEKEYKNYGGLKEI